MFCKWRERENGISRSRTEEEESSVVDRRHQIILQSIVCHHEDDNNLSPHLEMKFVYVLPSEQQSSYCLTMAQSSI